MASDAPIEKVTVTVNGVQIVLDPLNMKYNENSLGEFMNKEYGWIDYLGKQKEFADKEVLMATIAVSAAKNDHEAQYISNSWRRRMLGIQTTTPRHSPTPAPMSLPPSRQLSTLRSVWLSAKKSWGISRLT
jgi:hypothetical protein